MSIRKLSSSEKVRLSRPLLGLLMTAGLLSLSGSLAAATTLEAFETCKNEAEVAWGSVDEKAEVRLDGVRKNGKQLRLRVFTPEGEKLAVLCNVDRRSGAVVSMDPPATPAATGALLSSD